MKPTGYIAMWGLALWGEAEWAYGVFPATTAGQPLNTPDFSGGFASGEMSVGFNG